MRYESQRQKGSFSDGRRSRVRYRLRAGIEVTFSELLQVGAELRSGAADNPVSNNVGIDADSYLEEIRLDQAYVSIHPHERFELRAGKFASHDTWLVSDLAWDRDTTPEGLLENLKILQRRGRLASLDASLYQYLLEDSSSSDDPVLLGGQLRATIDLGERSSLRIALGYDDYQNPQGTVDLSLADELQGNPVSNLLDPQGRLRSDFDIGSLGLVWEVDGSRRLPIELSFFAYENFGAEGLGREHRHSFLYRLGLGRASEPGRVRLALSYYDSEPDGIFYAFSQSNTSFASDVEALRVDVRVGFVARSYFNVTYYRSEPKHAQAETMHRVLLDYAVRF